MADITIEMINNAKMMRALRKPDKVKHGKRLWRPEKCIASGKSLWFKPYTKVTVIIDGPGSPAIIHSYFDAREYILCQLKYR